MKMNSETEQRTSNDMPQPCPGIGTMPELAGGTPAVVAQTFLSAGSGDFPVASSETRDWKVPRTRRLESLRYIQRSQIAAAYSPPAGFDLVENLSYGVHP
jgi:hypothetical protein